MPPWGKESGYIEEKPHFATYLNIRIEQIFAVAKCGERAYPQV